MDSLNSNVPQNNQGGNANPFNQPTQPVEPAPQSYSAQPAEPAPQSYNAQYGGGVSQQNAYGAGQPNAYGAPQPGAPGQPPTAPVPSNSTGTGKATGALVCGILAIVFCFLPVVGLVLGIVAIVLAGKHLKTGAPVGGAKAGRICGIVGIAFSVIMFVVTMALSAVLMGAIQDELNSPSSSIEAIIGQSSSSSTFKSPGLLGSSSSASSSAFGSLATDDVLSADERAARDAVVAELEKLKSADEASVLKIAGMVEEDFVDATDFDMASCGIDSREYARMMLQDFDYQVSMVTAEGGGEYTVTADVQCRDVFEALQLFQTSMEDASASGVFDSMSADEAKKRIGELFMSGVSGATMETDGFFSIGVMKNGSTWAVNQEDWDFELDYYFGIY